MTVTLKFENGTEQVLSDVVYFAWKGSVFSCERITDPESEKFLYPWSRNKSVFSPKTDSFPRITQITIMGRNIRLMAETDFYSVNRDIRDIAFDVDEKHFLGNMCYVGNVRSFNANEN